MCGRISLSRELSWTELRRLLSYDQLDRGVEPRWSPSFNIAPTQEVAAIVNRNPARLERLRWGLIPARVRRPPQPPQINVQAEFVTSAHRRAFEQRRCLVLADAFYEWTKLGDDPTPQPFRFEMNDGGLFALAGLWEQWRGGDDGAPLCSCTIITCKPNPLVKRVHNRMPAIVEPADYQQWLSPDRATEGTAGVLRPLPAQQMRAFPVTKQLNSYRYDQPDCGEPIEIADSPYADPQR